MTAPTRILVIGSGGREHALAWRLAMDAGVERVTVAPGNPGMTDVAAIHPDLDVRDHGTIFGLAASQAIDLVVVGPEAPLVAGLADDLRAADVPVFGPGRAGARLEGSKTFCRDMAAAAGVPIADGRSFSDDPSGAAAFARTLGAPVVIKADGLAGGKGVTVCGTLAEAEAAISECAVRFGAAGRTIVVERALAGREVSVIAITDGTTVLALPAARDHKRIGDGDTGPNTGGMGACSPLDDVPDVAAADLADRSHRPILAELARRGIDYRGVLYAGLMLTDDGPVLLECNVRFGDPETQVLLPRLGAPLARLLAAAADGRLAEAAAAAGLVAGRIPGGDAAVGVVIATAGYPDAPRLGDAIAVDPLPDDALLFWSGVRHGADGRLVTSGGRVATVVGRGVTTESAADAAYAAAASGRFDGRRYRRDIARPATVAVGAR